MTRWLPACVIVLFVSVPAWAQTCIGATPIDRTSDLNLGTELAFNSAVTQTAFEVGGGHVAFARAGIQLNHYPDLVENSGEASVVLGSQIAADPAQHFQFCPIGLITYEFGPRNVVGTGANHSALGGFGGVSFAATVTDTPTVQIAPLVGVIVGTQTDWFRGENITTFSFDDTFGSAFVGVAIVLKGHTTITPQVFVPFMVDGGGDTTFKLSVSFPIGHRSARP